MRVLKSRPMTGFKAVQSNMAVDNPGRMNVGTVYSTKSMALADHSMFCFNEELEDAVRACLYSTAFKVYRCKVWGTVLDLPNFDAGIFKEITGIKEEELGL